MTRDEKRIRDIDTLRESMQIDMVEFRQLPKGPEGDADREAIRLHYRIMMNELEIQLGELWDDEEGDKEA